LNRRRRAAFHTQGRSAKVSFRRAKAKPGIGRGAVAHSWQPHGNLGLVATIVDRPAIAKI
jgi:hypothetical protein